MAAVPERDRHSLNVTLTADDLALGNGIGDVNVTAGLGQRLESFAKAASNSSDGTVTLAIQRRQAQSRATTPTSLLGTCDSMPSVRR